MKRNFTIIGLGTFGSTIALALTRAGNDVIGIDMNPELVNEFADGITQAVVADARDEKSLRDLGVHESDIVVIAIGENLEANVLATLNVKAMGKPKVWAEALNPSHQKILEKLGADHIVHPEHDMGLRLANTLMYPEVMDYISLGDDQFTVEIHVSERLAGKQLDALQLPANDVKCLLVKHQDLLMSPPQEAYVFKEDDKILLLGTLGNLRKVSKFL